MERDREIERNFFLCCSERKGEQTRPTVTEATQTLKEHRTEQNKPQEGRRQIVRES